MDYGGPLSRRQRYGARDFLFPQLTLPPEEREGWTPSLADYIFLSFNTSTAFSPTDTLVLSVRAKVLMMSESLISLLVIAVLISRAVVLP